MFHLELQTKENAVEHQKHQPGGAFAAGRERDCFLPDDCLKKELRRKNRAKLNGSVGRVWRWDWERLFDLKQMCVLLCVLYLCTLSPGNCCKMTHIDIYKGVKGTFYRRCNRVGVCCRGLNLAVPLSRWNNCLCAAAAAVSTRHHHRRCCCT